MAQKEEAKPTFTIRWKFVSDEGGLETVLAEGERDVHSVDEGMAYMHEVAEQCKKHPNGQFKV